MGVIGGCSLGRGHVPRVTCVSKRAEGAAASFVSSCLGTEPLDPAYILLQEEPDRARQANART